MPNYLKDSNNSRLDRWFIKSYNLKLSRSKLKSVIRTSALLSGFAMVAMVELDIDYESFFESFEESGSASSNKSIISDSPDAPISNTVLILYALVTCLLIGVNMIAIIISTCILPQLNALSYEDLEIETFSENFSNQETNNELPRNFSIKKIDTFDTTHFDLPLKIILWMQNGATFQVASTVKVC
ncbi:orai-2 [Brachionus plicatilis]|uniref:Orai-2 n=1 Tax=Brachionus plicatilis TaxID=10195 RepID=A0A3M7PM95_BRAPC|nr:orai-2 [Brachionus plicatilis]